MNHFFGRSDSGNLREALAGLINPKGIIMMCQAEKFEENVQKLEEAFPGVPSIGCIGMCYDSKVVEKGVGISAFEEGVEAVSGVLRNVSVFPANDIAEFNDNIKKIKPGNDNTFCVDFCSGNDACVLTTISGALKKNGISLVGGTGDAGKISVNGKIYENAAAYMFIKNVSGKVKVYKENIYQPYDEAIRLVASDTDKSKYYIGELNGRSAKSVYMDILKIKEDDITTQTFKNPFGKIVGDDICIVSIKEVMGKGLCCFRQVNDSDVLTILKLKDYKQIAEETISNIKKDFPKISGVFSVNCLFRYLLFSENGVMQDYLNQMNVLGVHCGLVGYGEHYNNQFVNQSMTCVAFD